MNYRIDLENAKKYIEDNIKESLSLEEISTYVGYSPYHFSRIFYGAYQMTMMEYVRKRKLELAIYEISKGKKIIDVAMEFGFLTSSGFSKAFKKVYETTPTRYVIDEMVRNQQVLKNPEPVTGSILETRIRFEKKSAFKVLGFATSSMVRQEAYTFNYVAKWQEVQRDQPEAYLYKVLNPKKHGEVGIFVHDASGGGYYVLGLPVENFDLIEEGMVPIEVPEAFYAVFTTIPVDEQANLGQFAKTIRKVWRGIFENWLPTSGYEYDSSKQDFEYYDERCHSDVDAVMEIWIPVKKTARLEQINEIG